MAKRAKNEITKGQAEILAAVLFGQDNRQIAARLFISEAAVKQRAHLAYKLLGYHPERGVANRAQFMSDYYLLRVDQDKLWLVNRYLSALIVNEAKEKDQLKRDSVPLPQGLQVATLSRGHQ